MRWEAILAVSFKFTIKALLMTGFGSSAIETAGYRSAILPLPVLESNICPHAKQLQSAKWSKRQRIENLWNFRERRRKRRKRRQRQIRTLPTRTRSTTPRGWNSRSYSAARDRKSTRLNSSHLGISYA